MDTPGVEVIVNLMSDTDSWIRRNQFNGHTGGNTKVNVLYLRKIVWALESALAQAQCELSSAKFQTGEVKHMNKRELNQYKAGWVKRNKDLFKQILDAHLGRTDGLGKELIAKARKDLGYSTGYIDQDLWRSLMSTYTKMYGKQDEN